MATAKKQQKSSRTGATKTRKTSTKKTAPKNSTARKPAALKSSSRQPSNFDGTLSHQWASRPAAPGISVMSFSRKESRTAFLAH